MFNIDLGAAGHATRWQFVLLPPEHHSTGRVSRLSVDVGRLSRLSGGKCYGLRMTAYFELGARVF